jgi:signal transduction histidine kinase
LKADPVRVPGAVPDLNSRRLLTFVASILGALALTVALVVVLMRPPLSDLMYLALLFVITGSASGIVGYISHRLGWWRRFSSLSQTLTLGYVVATALTLFNVWLTARLMFINSHDLTLAGLLLLFAGGISVSFGYFLSATVAAALGEVARAAGRLSEGDFSVRAAVSGSDEVAALARNFNAMAARLQQAAADERALDAARRDLVAWASHDLRTPLASLRAMLDALADGVVSEPETVQRYLHQSQSEIGRMSGLIDDLFELAQLDAGNLVLRSEPSSLSDLISDTLEGFSARAEARQIQLTGAVAAGVDPVWMAPDKISRVLRNLVENALRYTPAGGRVELQARPGDGKTVLVTIRDTGAGIPPADLSRVFDRFYRGDAARSRAGDTGAGLGLAIAKGVVEAHGGRIWAESEPGQGTAISFQIPRQPAGA